MKRNVFRILIYLSGMILVSLGIVLCVKCKLGISPISSVPYVLSFLTPLSFGTITMLFHLINAIFQYIAERKLLNIKVFLQIPIAVIFGIIIDFFKSIMTFNAENIIFKILLMILSILLTALGMHFMLSMRLVQNPPDGSVNLIAEKTGKDTGTIKIIYDILMVVISVTIGLIAFHKIVGFGLATVLSSIFVGKMLSVFKKIIKLKKLVIN